MQSSLTQKYLLIILIAIITVISFLYLIRPIADPDFFWHLKSGQWITEHGDLSLQIFKSFNDYSIVLYWFIMLLTSIALIVNFKKTDVTDVVLFAGTGFFSFMHVRYIPFFLIASLPVIGKTFSKQNLIGTAKVVLIPSAIIAAMFFAVDETGNIKNIRTGKWIDENRYPVKAADFIITSNFSGNMYNHYNWGGYLIWRLAPDRKVFIDGRFLDEKIYLQSMSVNIAFSKEDEALPQWKSILESYGVNYIITPIS